MFNREERAGIFWIAWFLVIVLIAGILLFQIDSQPDSLSGVKARSVPLPLGTVEGRLIDATTQEPMRVEDLTIAIGGLEGVSGHWIDPADLERPGFFSIHALPAGIDFELLISAPRKESLRKKLLLAESQTLDLGDLDLRSMARARVEVTDAAGSVVPAADVTICDASGAVVAAGQTDQRGKWESTEVPPGDLSIGLAQDEARWPVRIDRSSGGLVHVPLELRRPFPIRVEVDGLKGILTAELDGRPLEVSSDGRIQGFASPGATRLFLTGEDGESVEIEINPVGSSVALPMRIALPSPRTVRCNVKSASPGEAWLAARATRRWLRGMVVRSTRATKVRVPGTYSLALRDAQEIAVVVLSPTLGCASRSSEEEETPATEPISIDLELDPTSPWSSTGSISSVEILPLKSVGKAALLLDDDAIPWIAGLVRLGFEIPGTKAVIRMPVENWNDSWAADDREESQVQGRVEDSAGPIEGACVTALLAFNSPKNSDSLVTAPLFSTATNAAGLFQLKCPDALRRELFLRIDAPDLATAVVRAPEEPLTIRLQQACAVALRIADERDQPVPHALVRLRLPSAYAALPLQWPLSELTRPGFVEKVTAVSGDLVFRNLPCGEYSVAEISHLESIVSDLPSFSLSPGEFKKLPELRAERRRILLCRLRDGTGQVVTEATIEIRSAQDRDRGPIHARTDSLGRFFVDDPPPAPLELLVSREGTEVRTFKVEMLSDDWIELVVESP